MDKVNPNLSVSFRGSVVITTLTDEKILEQALRALRVIFALIEKIPRFR